MESGKAANSLHSPHKPSAPAGKAALPSAANRTVGLNKQQPSAPAAAPAKAGQKQPGPGKPAQAATAVSKGGQSKAPVTIKAAESSSSSSSSGSSSSDSEEEEEAPAAKTPAPKVGKEPAGRASARVLRLCCRSGVSRAVRVSLSARLLGTSELCLLLGRLQECEAGSSGALLDESSVFASALSSRSCAEEFFCVHLWQHPAPQGWRRAQHIWRRCSTNPVDASGFLDRNFSVFSFFF